MASILKVDTITGVSTAGSISVTGEGNSTTTNLQQGLAKCWVNFNGGGTAAIGDSLNAASITDQGTGNYKFTFTANMGNTDFCATGTAKETDSTGAVNNNGTGAMCHSHSASTVEFISFSPDGNTRDCTIAGLDIKGDLA